MIVVVHKTPGFKLSIEALVIAAVLDKLLLEMTLLSESLVVLISITTPAVGRVEETFTFKA